MRLIQRLVPVLLALLLASSLAAGATPAGGKQSYLVGLKPGAHGRSLAGPDVEVADEWPAVSAMAVRATPAGVARLRSDPGVAYVEEDVPRYALGHGPLPYQDGALTWGLQAVHAREAWDLGATGSGIRVCVLDTGIDYDHPEFFRNGTSIIKGSRNFVNDGHPDARDGHGHGTHVAATIAGQLGAAGARIGAAPDVELYIARVLGDDGAGTTSGVLNGLNWCVDTVRAHVANLSLGSSLKSRTEENAFNSAYSKGMLSIAAAGNDGNNRVSYPAGYASVVSVAAVDATLARAPFSQYNKDVELAGPGVAVLSAVPVGTGLQSAAAEDGTPYRANALEYSGQGNLTGPLVECGLADSTTSCTAKPASGTWIALVSRGSITFAAKHDNVRAQGASAMIVTNNDTASPDDPGSFTLGSPGTWLPSVSVSYNSGVAIRSGGLGTGSVSVAPWDYAYRDGTSMATPHATAAAALAWSARPTLSNTQIRSILQGTARDLGPAGRDVYYGYGLVQADAAVSRAKGSP